MKKILIYLLNFVIICFLIPILFTNRNSVIDVIAKYSNEENKNGISLENNISTDEEIPKEYDYREYNEIKLYHSKTNEIEKIALDEYLYGVVSAEMPANFEKEALKAQAVVARTYTIYKIQNSFRKTW